MNHVLQNLMHLTVRLECRAKDGRTSVGTGFHYKFWQRENNYYPVIITNKHVAENRDQIKFKLSVAAKDNSNDIKLHEFIIMVPNEKFIMLHPDPSVDLCAIPLGQSLNTFDTIAPNTNVIFSELSRNEIADPKFLNDLNPAENILMVGYPNGLWDSVNNKPLFRTGITATHVKYDYNGRKEFIIDAGCFPGSSGSPIFLSSNGMYAEGEDMVLGYRFKFLGILYARPQHQVKGNIIIDAPFVHSPVSITNIPTNLGYAIKAERISEIEDYFKMGQV